MNTRYNNLDGLRSMAAIFVIMAHVLGRIPYEISGGGTTDFITSRISAMANSNNGSSMVFLFFIISGFSMCCGYYDKIRGNQITLTKFYSRRYWKILPFFILLILLDFASNLIFGFDGGISADNFYEAFANMTLMFGFFPASDITVIGVGWTLGVIFGFYILFPFFVFLIWTKRRAWFSLVLMLGVNFVCGTYFLSAGETVRCNAVRWLSYFVIGGLLFLYRDKIKLLFEKMKKAAIPVGVFCVIAGLAIAILPKFSGDNELWVLVNTLKGSVGFGLVVLGAMCPTTRIWYNPVSRFLSKVSLEIYLSHMMVYQVIDKLGLTDIAGENVWSYIITCILTLAGVVIFAAVYKWIEGLVQKKWHARKEA